MGMDSYIFASKKGSSDNESLELACYRNFRELHSYIRILAVKKGEDPNDDLNCVEVYLTKDDLLALAEDDIADDELRLLLAKARVYIENNYEVYYYAWF